LQNSLIKYNQVHDSNTFLETLSVVERLAKKKSDLFRKYYELILLLEERTEIQLIIAFRDAEKTVMSKIHLLDSILSKSNIVKNITQTLDIPLEPRFKYTVVGTTRFKEYTFSIEMREWIQKAGIGDTINEIAFINADPFSEAIQTGMYDAYNTGGNTVFSTFDVGIDFSLRDKNVEKYFKNYSLQLSEQVSKSIQSSIKYELAQAIKNGDSVPEVRKSILKLWDKPIEVVVPPKISPDGTLIRQGYSYNMAPKHWANTVARTEINGAYNKGRLDGFKQTGVVNKVQYSTSPDERLCPICAPFEGLEFTLEKAVGIIPQHANCRCQWIPLLAKDNFQEASNAALENVINTTTMEQYFFKEGMSQQQALAFENSMKEVLGMTGNKRLYYDELKRAFSVGKEFDVDLDITKLNNGFMVKGRILAKQDYKNLKFIDKKTGQEISYNYAKGEKVGKFVRDFNGYDKQVFSGNEIVGVEHKLYVEHSSFFLDAPFQNKALGKELFKNQYEFYVKYGVESIKVYANGDVGYYAWAKYGFDFERESQLKIFRNGFEDWTIKQTGIRVDATNFNHSWDFATFNQTVNGVKLTGKDFMFHMQKDWNGALGMGENDIGRKILENYLSITK